MRSYSYEAAAAENEAEEGAEIGEVDFDSAAINSGEQPCCSCDRRPPLLLARLPGAQCVNQGRGWLAGSPAAACRLMHACMHAAPAAAAHRRLPCPPPFPNTVRLIGTVGGKKELRVFERSKLLPFAIGIKPSRRPRDGEENVEWCVSAKGRCRGLGVAWLPAMPCLPASCPL